MDEILNVCLCTGDALENSAVAWKRGIRALHDSQSLPARLAELLHELHCVVRRNDGISIENQHEIGVRDDQLGLSIKAA